MSVNLSTSGQRWESDDKDPRPRKEHDPLVALVVPAGSYRTADFVDAARALRVDLVVSSDGDVPMGDLGRSRSMTIDCTRPEWSASRIANLKPPPDAVIAADDGGVITAALASNMLGIPTNPLSAVRSTRDKAQMRGSLANAAVRQPEYRLAGPGQVVAAASTIGYPCVVKPRDLSASRGVMRVDTDEDARRAEVRIRGIVAEACGDSDAKLLVESFVSGPEVAVEGMLVGGTLTVLALLDKPDPLDGPFFEETMFVTPSRHGSDLQKEIVSLTEEAVVALGLVTGPIHAEVRCGHDGVVLVEIAARSIGGLCGRALTFGLFGESLESLVLRSALGMPGSGMGAAAAATGALMLPIPEAGILVSIEGVEEALAVDGVTGFDQTIPNGKPVVPLPEGDRYLGFLFAHGLTPGDVERTLRTAHAELDVRIREP